MRKKAAKQTTRRRTGSSPKQSGLIAKGKQPQRSATTKSTLDNRSHRTSLRITCRRLLTRCIVLSVIRDLAMLTTNSF